ncbi:MAG: carboxypeptidase regulatory-like domain-containing protein [Blastocatellia bacterium]
MQLSTNTSNFAVRQLFFFSHLFLLATVALLFLSMPATAAAQAQQAILKVTVRDQTGLPVVNASVLLKSAGATSASANTNAEGVATLHAPAGKSYEITVTRDGFNALTQGPVELKTGPALAIDLTLAPATIADTVNVTAATATTTPLEQGGAAPAEVQREQAKEMATRPDSVADTLPLLPGIARTDQGELRIFGGSENRAALLVGGVDVTDPATGQFGMTVPVDSVQTINVFRTPFLAQYGRFTTGVVAVETRRGGDKWNFELNDPFPEMRFLSRHLRGLREMSPRITFNGPLVAGKLWFSQGIEYRLAKRRTFGLGFPNNETVSEAINSFTQFDYIPGHGHAITATVHVTPNQARWFNLDFFNQRPVTPNYRTRDYTGTIIDRWTLGENLLESTLAVKQASQRVWGQGRQEMTLTPTGNHGNYFNEQDRDSARVEWIEMLSLKPITNIGAHNFKFGAGLTRTTNAGQYLARPINLRDTAGALLRRIEFAGGRPYDRRDLEFAAFGHDHWLITPRLAFDLGTRFERQNITGAFRIAPRFGVAWTPFGNTQTVIRTGYGLFYDRVPLNVFAFDSYPDQVITTYGPGGAVLDGPRRFINQTAIAQRDTPFISAANRPGNFSPYSATWNVEVEHPVTSYLRIRANYQATNSYGLLMLDPVQGAQNNLVLSDGASSRYRHLELTSKFAWKEGQQLFFSWVRSRSRGDLNEFNQFLGSFPVPVIRRNQYSNLNADMPNRFLMWGYVHLPWHAHIAPLIEWRTGFPYLTTNAAQNYAGAPNSKRYPNFLSLDARMNREFEINKPVKAILRQTLQNIVKVKVSVTVYNLTNHFNPTALHNNIADPASGLFFGQNKRRFRVDFDLIF